MKEWALLAQGFFFEPPQTPKGILGVTLGGDKKIDQLELASESLLISFFFSLQYSKFALVKPVRSALILPHPSSTLLAQSSSL